MEITERIDIYLEESTAKNVKEKVKTALDRMKFPYISVDGTKEDIEVTCKEKDTTGDNWAKLEKTLDAIVSKLSHHGIIDSEVTVTLSPSN